MTILFSELAAIRLGYGLSPRLEPPTTKSAILQSVIEAGPDGRAVTTTQYRHQFLEFQKINKLVRKGSATAPDQRAKMQQTMREGRQFELKSRIARALDAPAGFGERLVQFWADHFTIRPNNLVQNLLAAAYVDEAIRPNLVGKFEDLMFAALTHPMMLIYLDQVNSIGPGSAGAKRRKKVSGLNENLAREMIELHSLGAEAAYSQKDIRQLAELLTGLTFSAGKDVRFRPDLAEPGAETVLGISYGGDPARLEDIRQVMSDLSRHPATAQHIARKLAVHFVSDEPEQSFVHDLAEVWRESGGDLARIYDVLVAHPALARAFRTKVRQPLDYLISGLRALGMSGDEVLALDQKRLRAILLTPLVVMGQGWGQPRGPDGWPETAENWVTPAMLAARIDWATRVPKMVQESLPDPREFLQTTLGTSASKALSIAVPRAETVSDGVMLVLASGDFNRR